MSDLMQFIFRDGTGDDVFLGWLMVGLTVGALLAGGWLFLTWWDARAAARKRAARAQQLAEAQLAAMRWTATDKARETAWISITSQR